MNVVELKSIVSDRAMMVCNDAGEVKFVSSPCGELFGCPATELVESNLLHLVSEGSNLKGVFTGVFDPKGEECDPYYIFEENLKGRDGEFKTVIRLLPAGTGYFLIEFLAKDIIDVRQEKDNNFDFTVRILKALGNEKHINSDRLKHLSFLSHEFRTPLSTIRTASDILLHYSHRLDELQIQERLVKIQKSVDLISDLLDDVLALSRADSGIIKPKSDRINIIELVKNVIAEIEENHSREHQIRIRYDQETVQEICTDEKLIFTILNNLIVNAVKYTPARKRIDIHMLSDGLNFFFSIKDSGIGIDEEELEKIFIPYYRCDNVKDIPGTGLGLALVARYVELLKGEMMVASEPGIGTQFIFNIPLKING